MVVAAQQELRPPEMILLRDLRVLLCIRVFQQEGHEGSVVLIVRETTKQDLLKHLAVTSGRRPRCSASPGHSEAAARAMHAIDH